MGGWPQELAGMTTALAHGQDDVKDALLLVGACGSGKTTFLRHMAAQLWGKWTQDSSASDSWLPICISMRNLQQVSGCWGVTGCQSKGSKSDALARFRW
jgi:type II secretory pathway predicted ATPase ExeA